MKRNTAFIMAGMMIFSIVAGGVVFLFNVYAFSSNDELTPNTGSLSEYGIKMFEYVDPDGAAVYGGVSPYEYSGQPVYAVVDSATSTNGGYLISRGYFNGKINLSGTIGTGNRANYNSMYNYYSYYNSGWGFNFKTIFVTDIASYGNTLEERINNYLNDDPSIVLNEFSFTLEAGSVAYIEYYNQDIDLQMNTIMPELSTAWIAGSEPDFWPSSQTYIGNVNTLPVINDTLDYSNWDRISWSRGEPRNILGQTKNAIYSDTVFYGGLKYLTVYNYPYYLTNLDKAEVELSGAINITVTNAVSVTVYSALSGTINGVTNTIISNYGDNVSTDGQYTDQNGQIVTPTPGSGNYIPENSDMESVLSSLVSDIDSFFSGTWRHIRQFLNSAGKLPSFIAELYSWLPDEYKAVVFSAFSIVTVVAILKVML